MEDIRIWTKEEIREFLIKSDRCVCGAIKALYAYQTEDEKLSETTCHSNGVGFNGVDAEILSSFARQLQYKPVLSEKQMVIARKKILKYSGQLAQIKAREREIALAKLNE